MSTTKKGEASFSPEALKEKYRLEREKRLRPDGNTQYVDLSGVYADFDTDPYVEPGFTRPAVSEKLDVLIVGGGFGGMLAAARLRQAGVDSFRLVEKGGDFGGTWYWNRYPGAACDVESYIYLPLLEETGYMPTEKYAKAPEIFAHCQRIGRKFDLYKAALFQTQVERMDWDEGARRWNVTTHRGDQLSARFVIIAGGVLHKAKLPGIPGIETFKGHSFHTSRWDYAYTGGGPTGGMNKLADKRVGIIGTGATSVQAIPHLGASARQLYVFQRTPSGVGVRNNQPTDKEWVKTLQPGWHQERIVNFTAIVSGRVQDVDLVRDGWTYLFQDAGSGQAQAPKEAAELRQLADFRKMEEIRARVDTIVKDPVTAEALKPYYNPLCKRPCFHDEYLDTFNRPNVQLVDTEGKGVERITPTGVVVKGKEYPVDCLIYASGFEVSTEYTRRLGFDIRGRGGKSLRDSWADGAATLHGMHSRGYPNLLMFSTTQSGWAINFVHILNEQSLHAAYIVEHCLKRGIETIEPSERAQQQWWEVILGHLKKGVTFGGSECTPGYYNNEGVKGSPSDARRASFGDTLEFIEILRNWRKGGDLAGLEVTRAGSALFS
ncbi:NAD(P)/FAD-dependent oxidoreductase [Stigmatella sp. ncwal1]|uniref:NAD(P)/FAD-dependent oxidoreductase n=1 Tax=Stigmatella ashevillensis TaxID=2995309 RepID=A0ABT5DG01_9BACT|nr:NAD(P)/FAD-dependent oxidoreductase [Stigmatella ashevillena]MDC0712582.1 NAD(P)/FAD-dependent oxidoreductase [Stigmatella ashevillena]